MPFPSVFITKIWRIDVLDSDISSERKRYSALVTKQNTDLSRNCLKNMYFMALLVLFGLQYLKKNHFNLVCCNVSDIAQELNLKILSQWLNIYVEVII